MTRAGTRKIVLAQINGARYNRLIPLKINIIFRLTRINDYIEIRWKVLNPVRIASSSRRTRACRGRIDLLVQELYVSSKYKT